MHTMKSYNVKVTGRGEIKNGIESYRIFNFYLTSMDSTAVLVEPFEGITSKFYNHYNHYIKVL